MVAVPTNKSSLAGSKKTGSPAVSPKSSGLSGSRASSSPAVPTSGKKI